ncbi:DUF2812 domain-containing protein [Anaerobacillus arseniciselenatis]|uniref:DUF2812 domain-containing protein n=1 Tax=Anaerobacillus arseniciselenatis TaxID=85682 RepID=UPI000AF0CD7A|nr:DUF2812 domain-containing protein [Anaerobacillus arseniciselenatis]
MKIRKVFLNFEKEEKWLNEMAAKGMHFIGYTFCTYYFEKGEPGEYNYRIQLLDQAPDHSEVQEYLEFMKDSGVECVATYVRWAYFRKKSEEGTFEIYSDIESKIKHFKKIAWLMGSLALLNVFIALLNTMLSTISTYNLYFSFISWLTVLILLPITFGYIRRIKQLRREQEF